MIIQSAAAGQPHFAIKQVEHAFLSGQFAQAFGNEQFRIPMPRQLLEHVTFHHDDGWEEVDNAPERDPQTGLPYNFIHTPRATLIVTSTRSPERNEQHHPYCGLLSSMHSWGLYNGRYGLSDHVALDDVADESRPAVEAMLQGELNRQSRLKTELSADPATSDWIDEQRLMANYRLLQFFDTLALYFNMTHPNSLGEAVFKQVPVALGQTVEVTIRPVRQGVVRLNPYPFAQDGIEIYCTGRYLHPQPEDTDFGAVLRETPAERQHMLLVAS